MVVCHSWFGISWKSSKYVTYLITGIFKKFMGNNRGTWDFFLSKMSRQHDWPCYLLCILIMNGLPVLQFIAISSILSIKNWIWTAFLYSYISLLIFFFTRCQWGFAICRNCRMNNIYSRRIPKPYQPQNQNWNQTKPRNQNKGIWKFPCVKVLIWWKSKQLDTRSGFHLNKKQMETISLPPKRRTP